MAQLSCSDLLPLAADSREREAFRSRAAAHQQSRRISLGEHAILHFEDQLTAQLRLQEWLWASKANEKMIVQAQLDAYCGLVPDGSNLKATLGFAYADSARRVAELEKLSSIEAHLYAEVEGLGRSFAITEQVAVHDEAGEPHNLPFLRFEFSPEQITAVRAGAEFGFGIDDDRMRVAHTLKRQSRAALLADFD